MPSFKKTVAPTSDALNGALSRRGFVKIGLGFSAAVAVAAVPLSGCSSKHEGTAAGMSFLRADDVTLFRALIPAVAIELIDLPEAARAKLLDKAVQAVDATCTAMNEHGRGELRKLLGVLTIPALRWTIAGMRSPWQEAKLDDISAFLERWRTSRFETLNAGRMALVKLCCVNYYAMPETRAASGYPGPQPALFLAINS